MSVIELLILCFLGGMAYRHRDRLFGLTTGRRTEADYARYEQRAEAEPRYEEARYSPPARHRSPSNQFGLIAGIGLLVALLLASVFWTNTEGVVIQQHTRELQIAKAAQAEAEAAAARFGKQARQRESLVGKDEHAEAAPMASASGSVSAKSESQAEAPVEPSPELPKWTQSAEVVVEPGHIPKMLLVRKSKLCSTEDEAKREAISLAGAALSRRILDSYPHEAARSLSEQALRRHALRQEFVEKKLHDFKTFEDTMYVAYVQFEDSPQVREGLVTEWERAGVDQRVRDYSIGAGLITVGLGLISAIFRWIANRSSLSSPKPVDA